MNGLRGDSLEAVDNFMGVLTEDENLNEQDDRHCYIRYESPEVSRALARKLAVYILNHYSGRTLSLRQYQGKSIRFTPPGGSEAVRIRFKEIVDHIVTTRSFRGELLFQRPLASNLLDTTAVQHNIPATGVRFRLRTIFPNFPLIPTLESEGMVFSSFQNPIQNNILRLHAKLVRTSYAMLDNNVIEWVNDMRMLLNDSVSVVEITLHQLYFAAKYGLRQNWSFDEDLLGSRYGVRMKDKFRWIGQITGKPLDNAENEIRSFNFLKAIRNHFNHFDPPCFVISIDDAADWLNRIASIGHLLWKIREKLDAQLSRELLEIVLLRRVVIKPKLSMNKRLSQRKGAGYSSSTW